MANNDLIIGSKFNYRIDTSYGLSADGYIATGTESIVYKGIKTSLDGKTRLSCVLKFKYRSVKIGAEEGSYRVVDLYERFRSHDLKIFDELQDCRSVVRIFDVIEDLGEFSVTDTHVPEGKNSISINRDRFFCVVEEYIDGWSLEEYCRDEYWKLTETIDVGNNLKKKIPFHQFTEDKQQIMLGSYKRDYDEVILFQNEMMNFMLNLCETLKFITDEKRILHLDIKPDNIMVTRHGKELVLIDFGRSEHIDPKTNAVQSTLGAADYRQDKQSFARQLQYGTLGYAAPECFAEPIGGSDYPFDDSGYQKGRMSVESDIFSFGATFWECLGIFEMYTGNQLFASEKRDDGYGAFYHKYLLNDAAYCDRDLSVTSAHFHEKLEDIIRKCTRRRVAGYLDDKSEVYPLYYHDYEELQKDIKFARKSAPALVKTENIKVRNSFGVAGVMAGLICTVLTICGFLKLTGSYFAQKKIDSIMENYNPTKVERLEEAAVEQMKSSTESEKHNIYTKTYDFLKEENEGLDYSETVVLVDLLKHIDDAEFIAESVDRMLLDVEMKGFSSCVENTVTSLNECESTGYKLAEQIYNAQKRIELSKCYGVLLENINNREYSKLVKRLAQDLNHDEMITAIAEKRLPDDLKNDGGSEYINKMAEAKNEIKQTLDSVTKGNTDEDS